MWYLIFWKLTMEQEGNVFDTWIWKDTRLKCINEIYCILCGTKCIMHCYAWLCNNYGKVNKKNDQHLTGERVFNHS